MEVPEMYRCANWQRALRVQGRGGYSVDGPMPDTPQDRIHRVNAPSLPPFTLACTCGHFTVVSPHGQAPMISYEVHPEFLRELGFSLGEDRLRELIEQFGRGEAEEEDDDES